MLLKQGIIAAMIRLAVMPAVLGALFVAAPPQAAAVTPPSLILDSTGGPVTTRVTVTGDNFGYAATPANTAIVTVTFDGSNLTHETTNNEANLDPGEYILQGVAPGSVVYGNIARFTMVFKVPVSARAGTRALTVTNNATAPTDNGTAYFTVTARKLTLNPPSGLVSTKVTVTGENFGYATTPASTAIATVTFGGSALTHETTNSEANLDSGEYILQGAAAGSLVYGSAAKFTIVFKIPANSKPGGRTLNVTNTAPAPANNKTANFTVAQRKLTHSPSSGDVGVSVQATLSGFSPSTKGTLSSGELILNSGVETDDRGNAITSFAVPLGFGPGEKSNTVTFTDEYGNVAAATFKVPEASLSLDPIEGLPGTTVRFTGSGFAGYSGITVQFARPGGALLTVSTTPATIVSDNRGNVEGSIAVPGSDAGTATISVSDGVTTRVKDFTVKKMAETVQTVLQNIASSLVIVWGFDPDTQTWTKYDPTAPEVSDLTKLETGQGYWIQVSESVTLLFGTRFYHLSVGWNLIGWLGS